MLLTLNLYQTVKNLKLSCVGTRGAMVINIILNCQPVSSIKKTERLYSSAFYIKSFLFSTFLKFLLLKFLLHSFLFPHFDIISFQVCKKYHRFIISLVISFCYISFTPKSLTLFWLRHCAPVVFIHLFLCCNIIGNNKKKGECNNEII